MTSAMEEPPPLASEPPEPETIQINDPVHVERPPQQQLKGVVAYLGPVDFAEGYDWVGVRLIGPYVGLGKNDGTVQGREYFGDCAPNCGLFVRASHVTPRALTRTEELRLKTKKSPRKFTVSAPNTPAARRTRPSNDRSASASPTKIPRPTGGATPKRASSGTLTPRKSKMHRSTSENRVAAPETFFTVTANPSSTKQEEVTSFVTPFAPPAKRVAPTETTATPVVLVAPTLSWSAKKTNKPSEAAATTPTSTPQKKQGTPRITIPSSTISSSLTTPTASSKAKTVGSSTPRSRRRDASRIPSALTAPTASSMAKQIASPRRLAPDMVTSNAKATKDASPKKDISAKKETAAKKEASPTAPPALAKPDVAASAPTQQQPSTRTTLAAPVAVTETATQIGGTSKTGLIDSSAIDKASSSSSPPRAVAEEHAVEADPIANESVVDADPIANETVVDADPIANETVVDADPVAKENAGDDADPVAKEIIGDVDTVVTETVVDDADPVAKETTTTPSNARKTEVDPPTTAPIPTASSMVKSFSSDSISKATSFPTAMNETDVIEVETTTKEAPAARSPPRASSATKASKGLAKSPAVMPATKAAIVKTVPPPPPKQKRKKGAKTKTAPAAPTAPLAAEISNPSPPKAPIVETARTEIKVPATKTVAPPPPPLPPSKPKKREMENSVAPVAHIEPSNPNTGTLSPRSSAVVDNNAASIPKVKATKKESATKTETGVPATPNLPTTPAVPLTAKTSTPPSHKPVSEVSGTADTVTVKAPSPKAKSTKKGVTVTAPTTTSESVAPILPSTTKTSTPSPAKVVSAVSTHDATVQASRPKTDVKKKDAAAPATKIKTGPAVSSAVKTSGPSPRKEVSAANDAVVQVSLSKVKAAKKEATPMKREATPTKAATPMKTAPVLVDPAISSTANTIVPSPHKAVAAAGDAATPMPTPPKSRPRKVAIKTTIPSVLTATTYSSQAKTTTKKEVTPTAAKISGTTATPTASPLAKSLSLPQSRKVTPKAVSKAKEKKEVPSTITPESPTASNVAPATSPSTSTARAQSSRTKATAPRDMTAITIGNSTPTARSAGAPRSAPRSTRTSRASSRAPSDSTPLPPIREPPVRPQHTENRTIQTTPPANNVPSSSSVPTDNAVNSWTDSVAVAVAILSSTLSLTIGMGWFVAPAFFIDSVFVHEKVAAIQLTALELTLARLMGGMLLSVAFTALSLVVMSLCSAKSLAGRYYCRMAQTSHAILGLVLVIVGLSGDGFFSQSSDDDDKDNGMQLGCIYLLGSGGLFLVLACLGLMASFWPAGRTSSRTSGSSTSDVSSRSLCCRGRQTVPSSTQQDLLEPLLSNDGDAEDSSEVAIVVSSNDGTVDDDDSVHNDSSRIQGTRRLIKLAAPQIGYLYLGCAVLLVRLPFSLSIPHFISTTLGALARGDYNQAQTEIVLLFILGSIDAVFDFWCVFLFGYAKERIVRGVRVDLLAAILRQDIGFFDRHNSGELSSRLSSDCGEMAGDLTWFFRFSIESVVRIAGIATYMMIRCPTLGGCALAIVPVVAVVNKLYGDWLSKNSIAVQDALAKANSVAQEAFACVRTVIAFAAEDFEHQKYSERIDEHYRLNVLQLMMTGIYYMAVSTFLINTVVQSALLFIGTILIRDGKLTSEILLAFMLYQGQLQNETMNLFNSYSSLIKSSGAGDKVFRLLDRLTPPPGTGSRDVIVAPIGSHVQLENGEVQHTRSSVQLQDVRFVYPTRPTHPVLKGLNLNIPSGSTTALVGSSGCGKSTIVALLKRFYDPASGTILIDNKDLRSMDIKEHRRHVGVVTQDPVLFTGSILSNITYGCKSDDDDDNGDGAITREDAMNAAKLANAHNFVTSFPDGYDTEVGERGIALSGGQKQRIAIARAIAKNPSLLLLDEATSALDAESETVVQEALDRLLLRKNDSNTRDMTTIVVAHRLRTVRNADCIAYIHDGQVAEQGTHEELMKLRNGHYRRMVGRAGSNGLLPDDNAAS